MLTKLRSKAGKSKAPPSSKDPRSSSSDLKPPTSSSSTPASPAKALTARKLVPDQGQPPGPRPGRASVPVGAASPQLRTKEAAVSQLREMLVNGGSKNATAGRSVGGTTHPTLARATSQPNEDIYESFNNNNSIQSPIGSICHHSGCAQALQPVGDEPDIYSIHQHHPYYNHHHHHHPHPGGSSSPQQPIDFQARIRSAYRRSFIQGGSSSSSRTRLQQQQQLASTGGCGGGGGSIPSIPLHLPPPLHSLLSRSADRSLGQAFLVYRGETKRCRLPSHVTSLDTVRAMFVRAFPAKLTMTSFTDSTDLTIYTLDPTVNVFYELEDVREIGDMSVLKIVDRCQSSLVPLPVTVQSSRIHQSALDILLLPQQHQLQQHQLQHQQQMSPSVAGDRLSIYNTSAKWPASPHRSLYEGQSWPCSSAPYVSHVPNSPRLSEVDSTTGQKFDQWPATSDGVDVVCPRWSTGYVCCPVSMDETRMTVSDTGQSIQSGLTSQYHHHHLHHSVAYLPASSICCDAIDAQHHCHHLPHHPHPHPSPQQSAMDARPLSILCPSETESIVQAPSCQWTGDVIQSTGRTSPSASDLTTELDYDSRRRMDEVESRLVTLTTWLQNSLILQPTTCINQPEVNGRTSNDVTSGSVEARNPLLPIEGPARKDHRVGLEMARTIYLISHKVSGLKQEWRQLRDQNLERTREVWGTIQDIRLCIKGTSLQIGPANQTEPTFESSQYEHGNYCHVTNERASDAAGRSLQGTTSPRSSHVTQHQQHQHQHQHSPHQLKDAHGRHDSTHNSHGPLQDPYGPLDAIPPPAPLPPQTPDSPIWRRAEPSPQTPTRKTTEQPTSGLQGGSSLTSGQAEWTAPDNNDPSGVQNNTSPARGYPNNRNQAETSQWSSSRSPGKSASTGGGRHYSSGGQWIPETRQNHPDDWHQSTGLNRCAGSQWPPGESTGETPSNELLRSPGSIYARCGPPPPPPRRLSHSFVRETAKVFDSVPQQQQALDTPSRQQLVAARRVSMPGELRAPRPQSSSPARSVRLSSFIGHGPGDDGSGSSAEGELSYNGRHQGTKLNMFRSPTRLSRYTQDLATGIYSTFNRPDLQDQWLNVTDVETMRNALALQREIAANELNAQPTKSGNIISSSSTAAGITVGVRCAVMRNTSSSSSDDDDEDEDSSSASGDSQTTILRAPKQSQENGNKR